MAGERTFKVKIGDAEHEVEIPSGWLPEAEVRENYMPKTTFQAELTTRVDSIIRNKGLVAPDALLDNEEFKDRFIEHHGLDAKGSKGAEQYKADLKKAEESIRAREVKPLQDRAETLSKRLSVKTERELESEILTAAAGRVRESLLQRVGEGRAPIVSMLAPAFAHSEEHDRWFVKKGDGFAYPKKGDAPYMTAEEFVDDWVNDEKNKDFVIPQRQQGAELKGEPRRTGSGVVTISRADGEDVAKYRAAKAQAQQAGVPLQIVG